jgi:sialic acid synthase SpsE
MTETPVMAEIVLNGRRIGVGHPCYVIAEAGSNHDRDFKKAIALIDAAADAGVDAVKFQTYSGSRLYSRNTPPFEYLADQSPQPIHELLDDLALPRDWQKDLADHCRDRGVEFLSSPFDYEAVDELAQLGVAAFKVASFEIVDLPFLRHIGSYGLPVIVSTGMATLGEIEEALEALRRTSGDLPVCLLQCASLYPAPPEIMNLKAIPAMQTAFGIPVGLSDHTLGVHIAVAARALGADLLEKHFTLDRTSPGPDHPFAIEPDELAVLVSNVRDIEAALGDGVKRGPSGPEAVEMYTKARRSVVAAREIPAGTPITPDMLTVKRPGFGIKPRFIDALLGRRAAVDIHEDDVITWEMV